MFIVVGTVGITFGAIVVGTVAVFSMFLIVFLEVLRYFGSALVAAAMAVVARGAAAALPNACGSMSGRPAAAGGVAPRAATARPASTQSLHRRLAALLLAWLLVKHVALLGSSDDDI